MQKYNKFWVSLVGTLLVGAQIMFPDAGIELPDEDNIEEWLVVITSVITSLGVYALPNKSDR